MASVLLQVITSFHTNNSEKNLLVSANRYEKDIVSKEHCIVHHVDKLCFFPNCTYQVILRGVFKELLKNLETFFSNYLPGIWVLDESDVFFI